MDLQSRTRGLARDPGHRLHDAWWPIVLASLAAAVSWYFVHTVLGHAQPLFAPIAAAIALSSVLRTLAATLRSVEDLISGRLPVHDGWALRTGTAIHRELGALARAQSTARANVRIAPRRWRLRAAVDAERRRTTQLALLANAVPGLVRAAATSIHCTTPITSEPAPQISALAGAVERLAETAGPWPEDERAEVQRLAVRTLDHPAAPPAERDALTAAIIRAAADDLARVVIGGAAEWTAPDDRGAWHG
jgi:hypothetical protein